MRSITFICFLLGVLPLVSWSQSIKKPKPGFILTGQLLNAAGKKIYLNERAFYKLDNRTDSTKTDLQGNFVFRGVVSEPTYYMLETGFNGQGIGFMLENSRMHVQGNADSLYAATVSGSREEIIRQQYDQAYQEFDTNPFYQKLDEAKIKLDTIEQRAIKDQIKEISRQWRGAIFELMRKYPLAYMSVNQLGNLIGEHQAFDLKVADSLLTIYESSTIATSDQVKYFRKEWLATQKSIIGQIASNFVQPDTAGKPINLSSFKGRYVLVDFWASWCGPCREENPALVKAYAEFSNKNFTILSVSLDKDRLQWLKAIKKDKLNWTHVSDLKYWQNETARQYAVSSIPFNMLLDPEGKILALNLRGDDLQDYLKANLR